MKGEGGGLGRRDRKTRLRQQARMGERHNASTLEGACTEQSWQHRNGRGLIWPANFGALWTANQVR